MDYWNQILVLVLTPTFTITALTFLIKTILNHSFNRELERFKSELQTQVTEFQTRFTILHEKRAHVIDDLYRRIEKCTRQMQYLLSPVQYTDSVVQLPEKRANTNTALYELDEYYEQNRLYLDENICNMMDAFIKKAKQSINKFNLTQSGDQYRQDDSGMWIKAWDELREGVEPLRNELEKQFRELLYPINDFNKNLNPKTK